MYTYSEALVLDRTPGAQWQKQDLSTVSLATLFIQYRRIVLTLGHTTTTAIYYVDLEPLRAEYNGYIGTLAQWFVSLGDRALPTIPALPHPSVEYVRYCDAFRAGYHVHLTILGREDISIAEQEECFDLKVTRETMATPYDLMYRRCLVTVNGYLHPTDYDTDAFYVREGGRSFRQSRQNQLGLHSFAEIGEVAQYPITLDQIHPMIPDMPLKNHLYLTAPFDPAGKTVLLSLGGYLVLPDPLVFWQTGMQTYALCLEHLPYLERYFESSIHLDLSALQLSTSPLHPERVSAVELWSDAVIQRYCTLPQSFWIVVDTPHLFWVRRALRSPALPGMFISHIRPTQPLVVGYGKIGEYWPTYEDQQWSLTVQDSVYRHYIFDTVLPETLNVITNGTVPMHGYSHSRGWLLELGAYHDSPP